MSAGRICRTSHPRLRAFTVSDVDASAVRYLSRNFSDMTAVVNTSEPPLPFPSASFDVSYSWSLWTHLPLHLQKAYLAELRRVLRPGGWAFVTTNGHPFLDEYQAYPAPRRGGRTSLMRSFRTAGMLYHEFEVRGSRPKPRTCRGHRELRAHDARSGLRRAGMVPHVRCRRGEAWRNVESPGSRCPSRADRDLIERPHPR